MQRFSDAAQTVMGFLGFVRKLKEEEVCAARRHAEIGKSAARRELQEAVALYDSLDVKRWAWRLPFAERVGFLKKLLRIRDLRISERTQRRARAIA